MMVATTDSVAQTLSNGVSQRGELVAMCAPKKKKKEKKAKKKEKKGKENNKKAKVEKGKASYYADKFNGKKTASGEKFSNRQLTAAHPSLPFGTMVRVTNTANGRSVDVRINDRGPFKGGRIIDISKAAAQKIDMVKAGIATVTVEVIK